MLKTYLFFLTVWIVKKKEYMVESVAEKKIKWKFIFIVIFYSICMVEELKL